MRADSGKNDEAFDQTEEISSAWHIYAYKNDWGRIAE